METFYERRILPHLIKCACGCGAVEAKRAEIVPLAAGRVLELGAGGGLNFRHYDPAKVTSVTGIDPSTKLRAFAEAAPRAAGLPVELVDGSAEALPFAEASFDTVLSTYTLCTVPDAARAIAEARRVLRPGGRFLFCEHGLAPDAGVSAWQRRLDPLWGKLFGGCHLTRQAGTEIAKHFTLTWRDEGYLPKMLRIAGWTEWGEAV